MGFIKLNEIIWVWKNLSPPFEANATNQTAIRVTMGGGSWMGVRISDLIFVLPAKYDRHIGIMSALSHFLFLIDNSWRDASISFKLQRRIKQHKIQVKFEFGGHLSYCLFDFGLGCRKSSILFFCGLSLTFLQNYKIWQLLTKAILTQCLYISMTLSNILPQPLIS